ncbi:hypothetical protein B0H14DRAFT_2691728, partial [Mycena olivaceomarginata]
MPPAPHVSSCVSSCNEIKIVEDPLEPASLRAPAWGHTGRARRHLGLSCSCVCRSARTSFAGLGYLPPDLLRLSFTSKASCSCPRCSILDHMSASATVDMGSTPTVVRIPPDLVDARCYSTLYDDAVPPWDVPGEERHGARLCSFLRVPPRSIRRVRVVSSRDAGCGMWCAGHGVRAQRRVDRARRWGTAVASLAFTVPGWRSWVRGAVRDGERKEGMRAAEREALHLTGHSYALDSRASTLSALASQLLDLDAARNEGWKARSARRRGGLGCGA